MVSWPRLKSASVRSNAMISSRRSPASPASNTNASTAGTASEMNTELVFAGLVTVVLIDLVVENLLFRWIERHTVVRWGMSTPQR